MPVSKKRKPKRDRRRSTGGAGGPARFGDVEASPGLLRALGLPDDYLTVSPEEERQMRAWHAAGHHGEPEDH